MYRKLAIAAVCALLHVGATAQNLPDVSVSEEAQDLLDEVKLKLDDCLAKSASMAAINGCHKDAATFRDYIHQKYGMPLPAPIQTTSAQSAREEASAPATVAADASRAAVAPSVRISFSAGAPSQESSETSSSRVAPLSFSAPRSGY